MFVESIPSYEECMAVMNRFEMPIHIQHHSIMVAEIATLLGRLLVQEDHDLNVPLIRAGALLHDIGKARSIETGEPHAELGAMMLENEGYELLATIVCEHATMDLVRAHGPITESIVVNYADKRVKHDQVVTLGERFRDLSIRYGKTPGRRAWILERLDLYQHLEERVFEHLPILPDSSRIMSIALR